MPRSRARKSFPQLMRELEQRPALHERQNTSQPTCTEHDEFRSQPRKNFATLVRELELDCVPAKATERFSQGEATAGREPLQEPRTKSKAHDARIANRGNSAGPNEGPAADAERVESLSSGALGAASEMMAEGDQVLSQTKSSVLATIGHIQQLHREILGDHIATNVNRRTSAEITYLAALVGTLIGIVVKDANVISRARSYRA
jgi:hypothetical protein